MGLPQSQAAQRLYRYRFGTVEFDDSRAEIKVDDVIVDLEPRARQVLRYLLEHAGEAVSKQELLREIWAGRVTVDKVLPNAIAKLRQALGPQNAEAIIAVPRLGYRLTATVERTAVGRHFVGKLELAEGDAVPQRPSYALRRMLDSTVNGQVWLAEHRKTHAQRVFKFGNDGESLSTLKREATVSRLLSESLGARADILPLIDWNFDEPPFFLELPYGGANLLEWSLLVDAPLVKMPVAQRIALFLQIAEAVSAAHSVGVLHKDIKPTNVLVMPNEQGWATRLADFGSARVLDPHRLDALGITRHGLTEEAISATALYLAPEVFSGKPPTVRSDVYSLGLLLYQIIVADLRKPMSSGWERDIDDELLRADIAVATDGDPTQRLPTVAELVQRLHRLDTRRSELELRKADSNRISALQERLERNQARRPLAWGLLAMLCVGLLTTGSLYRKATNAATDAGLQLRRAEAINQFLNHDLLQSADPTTPGAAPDPRMSEVLVRAEQRVDNQFDSDPYTRAIIKLSLADAWYGLSDFPRAASLQKTAVVLLENARNREPRQEALYKLVRSLDMARRYEEAQTTFDAINVLDDGDNINLKMLRLWTAGGHHLLQLQPEMALPFFEDLERLRVERLPHDSAWQLRAQQDLAWCYLRLGRASEAELLLRPLLEAQPSLEQVGVRDWAASHFNYAAALMRLKRSREAQLMLESAVTALTEQLGQQHYVVGLSWDYLATSYEIQGMLAQSLEARQRAYTIYTASGGEDSASTLLALGAIGAAQQAIGHTQEATQDLERAYAGLNTQYGEDFAATRLTAYRLALLRAETAHCSAASALRASLETETLMASEPAADWHAQPTNLDAQINACIDAAVQISNRR